MTVHSTQGSLSETRRTVVYAVLAALSIGLGFYTYTSNQPKKMAEFEKIGEEFYPDFVDTDNATSLFVAAYDEDEDRVKTFEVEHVDGSWRIPTHFNYPADARDQFARTAVSIMGIRREALISRRAADHEKLGVIDPESTDISDRKGRGERITIKNENEVVADYIIGKSYPGDEGAFYVRAPEEKETFVAHFQVELSTKFQDWIDVDLLNIKRDTLAEITIDKYSLSEKVDPEGRVRLAKENVEEIGINREKFGDPWQIADLNTESDEVNHDAVKALVSALVDTKILGVRPKPEGLTPSLGVTPEAMRSRTMIPRIRSDLASRGFYLVSKGENELGVFAQEGSFYASTNEGLGYELHFGNVFNGNLREIELGITSDRSDDEPDEETETSETGDSDPAENETDSESSDPGKQKSRYLFVKVSFDQAALGAEPTRPEPPEDPGPVDPEAPLSAPRPGEPSLTPLEKFELAEKKYELDLKQFEQDTKSYQEKLEVGRKKAKELSDRLGAWYYVVPAKDVEALRVSRADLLQPKGTDAAKEQAQPQPGAGGSPQLPFTPGQLQLPKQN